MFLEFTNNNGSKYIRVAESVRVTKDGKKVTRKNIIKNIGPVSRFDDGQPDFERRLKDSFLSGKPLIPDLIPYVPKKQPLETYSFQITEGTDDCIGHPKLYAHCLLDRIMEELEITQVVSSYKSLSKIDFDLLGYLRLLLFGRILDPASKIATARQNERYYEPLINDDYEYHVYDTLDFVFDHKRQIFNRVNSVLKRKFGRKTDVVYYDVTNFYFEIESPDEDETDEDGNILIKGLRKQGVSKENRKSPIVQMGLFMDNTGIPISCEIFPGNTLDHLTVRTAMRNSVDNLDFGRFIFVGDCGMCSYANLLHILSLGNGYVVSKSIAKSRKEEQEWIIDDKDYIVQSPSFKYKSKVITRRVKDESGHTVQISEKLVCYWDKSYYDREMAENKSFLEFIEKLLQSPNSYRVTATQSKSVRRFLKNEYLHTDSGEMLEASKLRAMVDPDKVNDYKKRMGYYQIISSELNKSEKELIDIYHGLSRIEDQFRVMKGTFDTRPVFVNTQEHIDAHLSICTLALIMLRIIQLKIQDSGLVSVAPDSCWSYGISAERIQAALNLWTVEMFPGDLYRFNNLDSSDLRLILKAFHIEIPKKLFRRLELKSIKTGINFSN